MRRFVVDLKKILYEFLKELVTAGNLRRGNAAPKPKPTFESAIEGAVRCLYSQQSFVCYAEGGGGGVWYVYMHVF